MLYATEYIEKNLAKVFFLNKLKKGARAKEYEKWVHERDYPAARKKMPSVRSYHVHRVEETIYGEKPCDYVEVIEVKDAESFKKDIEKPEIKKLLEEWKGYIGESAGIYTEVI